MALSFLHRGSARCHNPGGPTGRALPGTGMDRWPVITNGPTSSRFTQPSGDAPLSFKSPEQPSDWGSEGVRQNRHHAPVILPHVPV
jgi:hypothetical protein